MAWWWWATGPSCPSPLPSSREICMPGIPDSPSPRAWLSLTRIDSPLSGVSSAGGWLGRAVVGDTEWIQGDGAASDMIKALVTLGAPHFPPDTASYPDAKDMTQGALTYTHATFPGESGGFTGLSAQSPTHTQPSIFRSLRGICDISHPRLFHWTGAHVKQYGIACVSVASGAIKGVKEAEPGTPVSLQPKFPVPSLVCLNPVLIPAPYVTYPCA